MFARPLIFSHTSHCRYDHRQHEAEKAVAGKFFWKGVGGGWRDYFREEKENQWRQRHLSRRDSKNIYRSGHTAGVRIMHEFTYLRKDTVAIKSVEKGAQQLLYRDEIICRQN